MRSSTTAFGPTGAGHLTTDTSFFRARYNTRAEYVSVIDPQENRVVDHEGFRPLTCSLPPIAGYQMQYSTLRVEISEGEPRLAAEAP